MAKFYSEKVSKSPRIDKLKADLFKEMPQIEADRAVLLTESYMQTEGEPIILRRAKAFENILDKIPITIRDDELIVGSATKRPRSCQTFPEFSFEWLENEFDTVETRTADPFYISEETKKTLHEVNKYWKGKTTSDLATSYMSPETLTAMKHNMFTPGNYFYNGIGHVTVDYGKVLTYGYSKFIEEVKDELASMRVSDGNYCKKHAFLEAVLISLKAVIRYAKRYARLAEDMAKNESDPKRKAELLKIAENCDRVPEYGARNFYEACQSFWFVQMLLQVESSGHSISPGRFDQYMYPFYKHDIEAGTITVDRVFELICSLYMKLNEPKMRTVQSLAVGGICCESGEDACNDLSKLCLEAMSTLKTPYPNMSARVMPGKTPDWFYDEIMRTVKAGCGQPMVLNDAVWVPNLTSLGIPEKWARDYYNMGCTEIMIQGKDCNWTTGGLIFFPELLNAMIRKSAAEGRTYESFEEFLGEYLKLIDKQCDEAGESGKNLIHSQRERNCDPFASSLIDGCLENATDYFQGGTDTGDPISVSAQGLGTAADSLSAIRKFVFEENRYTLAELGQMLHEDFAGHELDRLRLANGAPKFGNDDDYVDEIAKRLFDSYAAGVRRQNEDRLPKTRYVDNVFSYNMHITLGESLGATANGRSAGEAISDCVGPTQGADTEGSTALLNSVLKLSHKDVTGAHALNFKISPSFVKDREGTQAAIRMLKVYLEQMGPQIQINYQNPKDLLDAQVHPDKHRDLVVRIAGYCEYFVNLDHRLQCEIIERTLHEVG